MNSALLDTDILIEIIKGRNPAVVQEAANYLKEHAQFAFSAFTRYEILRGIKAKNALVQEQRFAYFTQKSVVIPISDSILDQAVNLWVAARQRGLTIGDADLIIAASAVVSGRTLVTGNTPHFSWIPGLTIENWRQI